MTTPQSGQPEYLTLEAWAAGRIVPQPSLYTLRSMVRTGMFDPPAVKIGKAYYLHRDARVIDPHRRPTLVQRMQAA